MTGGTRGGALAQLPQIATPSQSAVDLAEKTERGPTPRGQSVDTRNTLPATDGLRSEADPTASWAGGYQGESPAAMGSSSRNSRRSRAHVACLRVGIAGIAGLVEIRCLS